MSIGTATHSEPDARTEIPEWVPKAVRAYLEHVCNGVSIRELARRKGCHASTILRQVRKIEAERDDPLKDEALERLSKQVGVTVPPKRLTETPTMTAAAPSNDADEDKINREARRVLRRLCETRAFLLVSPDLEKAAVFRETVPGKRSRIAVVDRNVAQAFALSDWIEGKAQGRVCIYTITSAGRAALKRLIADERSTRIEDRTYAEEPSPFQEQHRVFGSRLVGEPDGPRKIRYNLAESPLTVLGRKRGPDGSPYLTADLIDAGERLREDFELAQMGPRVTQNWDNFLTTSAQGQFASNSGGGGSEDASRRVASALGAMGPGLADIAFRCCCFLEGLETAEKRLGWSARSGKIVLKIALQRLAQHYQASTDSRLIGVAAKAS